MMKNKSFASGRLQNIPFAVHQQGSVLLEALIAMLIFSFGILAITGLQAAMMKNTADATYRAEAAYVVQQRLGQILINPLALSGSTYKVPTLPNGTLTVKPLSAGRLQFIVQWKAAHQDEGEAGEELHKYEATTSVFLARQAV
jgi:type IV pilus assembly protein PilV